MIRLLYNLVYYLSLALIGLFVILSYLLFDKEAARSLVKKQLDAYGLEHGAIKGNLYSGISIEKLRYKELLSAEAIKVEYDLSRLVNPTPRLSRLRIEGLYADMDKISELEKADEGSVFAFALNISKADIKNSSLIYGGEKYFFEAAAREINIREGIDIERIKADILTPYAKLNIDAKMRSGRLKGNAWVLVNDDILSQNAPWLEYKPRVLHVSFDMDEKELNAHTAADALRLKEADALSVSDIDAKVYYRFKDDFFSVRCAYGLTYQESEFDIKQNLHVGFDKKISSSANVRITKDAIGVPFGEFTLKTEMGDKQTKFEFDAQNIVLEALTKEFKIFEFNASYTPYGRAEGEADVSAGKISAALYPNPDLPAIKPYYDERFSKIFMNLSKDEELIKASFESDMFSLSLTKDKEKISGSAKIADEKFDIKANISEKKISAVSNIASINRLLEELGQERMESVDASAKISADIFYKEGLYIDSRVDMPSYSIKTDKEHKGRDAFLELSYKDRNITLKRYAFEYAGRKIYSDKPSSISVGKDNDIRLIELRVYDNVAVKGVVKPSEGSLDVNISSPEFHYAGDEANVSVKLDLRARIDAAGTQKIQGEIILLDGEVFYEPKREFLLGDEDIIIIQEIKEEKKTESNRELGIRISSAKDIRYKSKTADIELSPELFIHQKALGVLEVFGTVNIKRGEALLGERVFEFEESEIYFFDGKYANPHLNLNLHYYTLDDIDIGIYVTNTLFSPVIILSSDPYMSQEDIMSYILFGAPSSSVFDTNGEGSRTNMSALVLGAGLKELLSSTTKLKIDTLNILTNEEGTLGYEIGTRFGKKFRVVYKNDEISSLIVQYSLSRSLRIDVDIKETGQGVGIFYIKDFR